MDVSIIIPVYNTSPYLTQCLKSIPSSNIDLEVICINDGSTDDSLSVLQSAALEDDRIAVVDKANEGYGATVNLGIERARGTYIAILEPDDYLEGDMYTQLLTLAVSCGLPDIVKSAYWSTNEEGTCKRRCGFWKRIRPPHQPFIIEEAPLLLRYHPSIWSALYRQDFLKANGIRFHEVHGAGWVDNPFLMDTMLRAKSIAYTDEAFYCYRDERDGSSTTSMKDFRMPIDRWLEMADVLDSLQTHNAEISGIQAYRAFRYLDIARKAENFEEEGWHKGVREMLQRLDPETVAHSAYVSPSNKSLYEEIVGPLPTASNAPYRLMLAKETYWKARQNGLGFLLNRIKQFAKSR